LGEAQLGIIGQVADLDGEVVGWHRVLLLCWCGRAGAVVWLRGGRVALVAAAAGGLGAADGGAVGVAAVQAAAALPPAGRGACGAATVWGVVSAMVWS
jgi:hypothetical protein